MKNYLFFICLLIFNISFAQNKKKATDEEKLAKSILENTNYFTFDGNKPSGKGWEILANLFAENQFVAWGEYHNSPSLSQLTHYALEEAAQRGCKTWCIETSPFAASELSHIANTENPLENLAKINQKRPKFITFPFFESKEDIAMLSTAKQMGFSIWGIDQEFQMAFPYCFDKAYESLSSRKQEKMKPVYDSLQAKWWNPDASLVNTLKKEVNPNLQRMLEDINISKDIYYYSDNQKRAMLMKANFYRYYDLLKNKNEKIFFKMGSNHLAKGMNLETNLYDIGNAVYELSQRNQTGFANIYFMVRFTEENGKISDDMEAEVPQNPKVFSRLYDKEKWVLLDLKSLRLKIRYDNSLTPDTYKLIEKYDYVVISPEILK